MRALKRLLKVFAVIAAVVIAVFLTCLIGNAISRDSIEAYIDSFQRVEYENQLTPTLDERGNYRFVTDGDFKVMQLTDVHIVGGFTYAENDKKALHAVASMIEVEKPDLVIVTGDISFAVPWGGSLDNSVSHGYFIRLMERLGVYWTVTFGNHDAETYNIHNRSAVAEMYSDDSLEYCLFSAGPEDVFGECNHIITVENSQGLVTSSYVMIDSNAYREGNLLGFLGDYDNVHDDQVEWYKDTIEYYTERNLEVYNSLDEAERPEDFNTGAVLSYMYMHIPPEEMRIAYNEAAEGDISNHEIYGIAGEDGKVVYSSEYSDNLFETVLMLGSTKGIFFGHDHLNSLRLNYRGVTLAYGYSIDYSAYAGSTGYQRGCTLLTVSTRGEASLRYSNYYSGLYDNLNDEVDMTLPGAYN